MRKKNKMFIFPPQFEPFQPYLSLPILCVALEARGHSVKSYDFNIDYFNWVLTPDYIEQSLREPKTRKDEDEFIIQRGEYALEHLVDAIRVLKTPDFIELPKYKWSVNVLRTALEVVSERFRPSKIDFYEARCGPTNYNSYHIYSSINDPHLNLFEEFINGSVLPIIQKDTPDFVGFSLVVHDQIAFTLTLCREIRKLFPNIHLCAGGPLVSRLAQEMATDPHISQFFDSFVVGEGEETICELAEALEAGTNIAGIPGVLVPGKENEFKRRRPIDSLSTILPDFSYLPLDEYFSPYLVLPYLSSHGCYWGKCAFCCHRYPYDKYREKPIELIVDQLAQLSQDYKTNYFSFSDEDIPPPRMRDLALEIINRGLDIKWFTFVRMEKDFKEPDFCNLIYRAGCRTLMFGFESAVQRVLNLMEKGTKAGNVPEILSACKKASISVRLDAMIGFPGESEPESDYTLKFIREHRNLIDTPFSITPLSMFGLQKDSPIMQNPERYGVYAKRPVRGDLDYQVDYEIPSGMDYARKFQAYRKYISTLNSEFEGPNTCPENKTHAFLMKCLYDEGQVCVCFLNEIKGNLDSYVAVLYPGVQCTLLSSTDENVPRFLLSNLLTGMQAEIDCFCNEVLGLVEKGHSIAEILANFEKRFGLCGNDLMSSFMTFLKFLYCNNFISFISRANLEHEVPVGKISTAKLLLQSF